MVKIGKLVKIAVKIVNSKKIAVIWEQKVKKLPMQKITNVTNFRCIFLPIFSNIYYSLYQLLPFFTKVYWKFTTINHSYNLPLTI